jgi:hypothetical protein
MESKDSSAKEDPNATKLRELEAQYGGRLASTVSADGKLLAFRCPTLDEWEDYQDALGKKRRGVCFRELAQVCVVYPTLEELQAVFEREPALATRISDGISSLAGLEAEVTVKKG